MNASQSPPAEMPARALRVGMILALAVGLILSWRQMIRLDADSAALRPLWVRAVYAELLAELPPGREILYYSDFDPAPHHLRRFSLQFDVVPRVVRDTQDPVVAAKGLRAGTALLVELAAPDAGRLDALAAEGDGVVAARSGPRLALLLPGGAR